ncbi:MAG: LysR family transcriptional regulator [Bilifractor sp.]|nr:LysR family transcriptional regulator [Lachnospiraceae bacterium]MDY2837791.1 LysR family transcriptional regulator [Bilifractor sp.]
MTLQQIKYVITVAEKGSMNKAAEELFVAQPTLTAAIHELEKEVGITIFIRTSRGVFLTSEGQEFLNDARQLYQEYEWISDKYSDVSTMKQKFSVSSQHYSFVDKAFVETVKQFGTQSFDFSIREEETSRVIENVKEMRSQVGIIFLSDFNRKILTKLLHDGGLEFNHIIDTSAYVYLWKKHPLASNAFITFDELKNYPCLSFDQGPDASAYLAEEILTELDYPRMIHATDRATMLNLMVGLNGYTLCTGIICEELNGSDYIAVPFQGDDNESESRMELGYIQKKGYLQNRVGKTFLNEVMRYFHLPPISSE